MSRTFNATWSTFVLAEFISSCRENLENKRCLDIGSGTGEQSSILRAAGLKVVGIDKYEVNAQIRDDFIAHNFQEKYDFVLCSHVLEHQRNVGLFLDKIYDVLAADGLLILSVPKHPADRLIEGHLACFRTSYLIQNLLYSGFDLMNGKFLSCGLIENSAILPKREFSCDERMEAGYKWTSEHQRRSFLPLSQASDVPNDGWFFYNCEFFENGKVYPVGSAIKAKESSCIKDIRIVNDRFGVSFDV